MFPSYETAVANATEMLNRDSAIASVDIEFTTTAQIKFRATVKRDGGTIVVCDWILY